LATRCALLELYSLLQCFDLERPLTFFVFHQFYLRKLQRPSARGKPHLIASTLVRQSCTEHAGDAYH